MAGATDFFFTWVLGAIALFFVCVLATQIIGAILDWQYNRECKKLRFWLLGIFDDQLDRLRFRMEQDGRDPKAYGLEFSDLRYSLTLSTTHFYDMVQFRNGGAPFLLVFPKDVKFPRLLTCVSSVDKEIPLFKHTAYNPDKKREKLLPEEVATLKELYPNLAGQEFTYYFAWELEPKVTDNRP
jgi:hypothetical protein